MDNIKEFDPIDPLECFNTVSSEAANRALKRSIVNILHSYVGWYDPFCELIQNALDSLDERINKNSKEYKPIISITINMSENYVIVTDNGMGLNEQMLRSFLAPNYSFKSGETRGHKGVGATYLAYGFNYIQICSKTEDFSLIGKMVNARNWLKNENPAGNPEIIPDKNGAKDTLFNEIDSGASFCIKFDENTRPKQLRWIKTDNAEAWLKVLKLKTGLGAFEKNDKINIIVKVVDTNRILTIIEEKGIEYFWPHLLARKPITLTKEMDQRSKLISKGKEARKLPSAYTNIEALYDFIDSDKLFEIEGLKLSDSEINLIKEYKPKIYFCFVYSVPLWKAFNDYLHIRENYGLFYGGIQIFADNMPQGERIQIPLKREIGRQNQLFFAIYFKNCSADLGRKGFQRQVVDLSQELSKKIMNIILKFNYVMKPSTGVPPDIIKETTLDKWKEEMMEHEKTNPLNLINDNFFLPLKKVCITSAPTREQDVIALFNQFLAGGIIRGIKIMSTNERTKYDGLYRIVVEEPDETQIFDEIINPLGILKENFNKFKEGNLPFESGPKILEYKFSLDGLIEDIRNEYKNPNDIGLVVVWETGELFKESYTIRSLLDEDNLDRRTYHGITHIMNGVHLGERDMDLIVLKELIDYLNDPKFTQKKQKEKYEDFY